MLYYRVSATFYETHTQRHLTSRRAEMNAYNILFGKPRGKRPLGRHRSRWEQERRYSIGEPSGRFIRNDFSRGAQRNTAVKLQFL